MPTFELNRSVTLRAEAYGFDFALSMIKPHVWPARLSSGITISKATSVSACVAL
jgi:hypothetical protein